MVDLSIVIAARNENYLKPTVLDLLAHTSERTEIIVVCDGLLPVEPLDQHPRLNVVLLPQSIGQRAAVNLGARLSGARYICKADAHVSIAPNFDTELLRAAGELGPDVVQIPRQYHLHVFNWKCQGCGTETYQGPTPTMCAHCAAKGTQGGPFERIWMWERRGTHWRKSTEPVKRLIFSDSWCFDSTLHFQYEGRIAQRQHGDLIETMSCLGACWFLDREYFWSFGGLDENHGSWGQMGQELACKTWLSGGRMVTNRRTWFAHLFRTQGGPEWGFPYPQSAQQVEHARVYARDLWMPNAWPQQIHSLRWLVEKFWPVKGWTEPQLQALPSTLRERAA